MEEIKLVCQNKWCKAHFIANSKEEICNECPKCRSFENDLSGGVKWEDKKYFDIIDNYPHETKIKINTFK